MDENDFKLTGDENGTLFVINHNLHDVLIVFFPLHGLSKVARYVSHMNSNSVERY